MDGLEPRQGHNIIQILPIPNMGARISDGAASGVTTDVGFSSQYRASPTCLSISSTSSGRLKRARSFRELLTLQQDYGISASSIITKTRIADAACCVPHTMLRNVVQALHNAEK
eukprot:6173623-Pleurochrysis_carterae.AAC.2